MKSVVLRQSRFIHGVFHEASASSPKVIQVPDELQLGPGMELHKGGEPEPAKLKQAFNDAAKVHVQSSAEVQSKPEAEKSGKGKRAADQDPA